MTSYIEQDIELLKSKFSDGIENYMNENMFPFYCTFFVPSEELYIDLKYDWKYQGHEYDETSEDDVNLLKYLKDNNYEDAVETWTIEDPYRKEMAASNNLKYIEFYDHDEFVTFMNLSTVLVYTDEQLNQEYSSILRNNGHLSLYSGKNKIVKNFQQYNLYQEETRLMNDLWKRYKLMKNRAYYINKTVYELTPDILINGCKIAGLHYGFSMFNPMLAKWFVQNYNLEGKTCYDPTGGWGHRLLGIAPFVKKYIYNDLSPHTVESCKEIARYCNLLNVDFYNNDATSFCPDDEYDFMFTCPPYYADKKNTEDYECDGFKSAEDFEYFMLSVYDKFLSKPSCKYFGLVIREDMLPEAMKRDVKEKYSIARNMNSHYARTSKAERKRYYEYLYVFKK